MEHRHALFTAGAVAAIILAGSVTVGAALGVGPLGSPGGGLDDNGSSLDADLPTTAVTVIIDDQNPPGSTPLSAGLTAATAPESTSTAAVASTTPDERRAYRVGDAGVVTINRRGEQLSIDNINANAGWAAAIDRQGGSAEATFRSADGLTLRFVAELRSGQIAVRVEDRTTASATSGAGSTASGPTAATVTTTDDRGSDRSASDDRDDPSSDDGAGHDIDDDHGGQRADNEEGRSGDDD